MPENIANAGRHCFKEPNVDDRDGQIDVGHPLSAHFGEGDFYAATIADNSFVLDFLVFSASALPVPCRPENLLAKKTALFGLKCAVVDRLRLFNFPARPLIADHIVRRNLDGQLIKLGITLNPLLHHELSPLSI